MDKQLTILYIEDDPLDIKLVRETLADGGVPGELVSVDTRKAFLQALEHGQFDVILADYRLPGFNGKEALELARSRQPNTPFIFVTGAIGEEAAIALMKQGATDYVLKDRLSRLVPAVRRALEEAKEQARRREADRELKESNLRLTGVLESISGLLERLFENSHVLIAHLDSAFTILRVNQAYAQANQREPTFFNGKSYFALHPNPDTQEIFSRVLETGEAYYAKAKAWQQIDPRAHGEAFWNWSVQPVRNERGAVEGLLLCLLDVTRHKQSQRERVASERKYRDLVENVDSIIMRWRLDGTITFANRFARQFFGYPTGGLIGGNVAATIFPSTSGSMPPPMPDPSIEIRFSQHDTCERECVRRDGSQVWIRWTCRTILTADHSLAELLCVGSDITDRKLREHGMERIQKDLRAFARTMGTALHGRAVSPGLAEGVALLYSHPDNQPESAQPIAEADVDSEVDRLEHALAASIQELETLRKRFMIELSEEETAIVDVHLAMLLDSSFAEKCKRRVRHDLVKVEHAVAAEVKDLETLLQGLKQEVMRERSVDVRDIGRRVLSNLKNKDVPRSHPLASLPPGTILVSERLLPSDTLELDRRNLAAFVTEQDGPSSHVAILARAMAIPAICDVNKAMSLLATGDHLLVDADVGTVTVAPTAAQTARFAARKTRHDAILAEARQEQVKGCMTQDGVSIRLHANIGRPDEVQLVTQNRMEGVGLFRSEFLFLDVDQPPELETQREAYVTVARFLKPLPVVIRTMDLGGDKIPRYAKTDKDLTLRMGRRGLFYSLTEKNLFQTQIRAILQASLEGNVLIMFPMVMDVADLREARRLVEELAATEQPGKKPVIGAMIETPAAVFTIHEILEISDFVSIGTNDLAQYILARDRSSPDLAGAKAFLNPSVIRAVDQVVRAAQEHATDLSVCGEAAGDPMTAFLLAGMGVRNLSMSPFLATQVRLVMQHMIIKEAEQVAREALVATTADEVQSLVKAALGRMGIEAEQ